MPNKLKQEGLEEITNEVIRGFETAACSYFAISGGWELYRAPEYFSTVKVAERIAKASGRYVTLEQNVSDAIRWSNESEVERAPELPDKGRFDIAVWGPRETGILGIIEIKEVEYIRYSIIERDIKRVCDAIGGSIQWGIVAWYASVWGGSRKTGAAQLKTRTQSIEQRAREYAASAGVVCKMVDGDMDRQLNDEYGGGVGRPALLAFQRETQDAIVPLDVRSRPTE